MHTVNNENIINQTREYVKKKLNCAEGGHDWWHTHRVWLNAKFIANKEGKGDKLVIELAALLHDIADAKFHNGDETIAPRIAREFLTSLELPDDIIDHVIYIIENMSFRKRHQTNGSNTIELQIVQDADRLEAIGAIGIARVFNYGGFKHRPLFVPESEHVTPRDSKHTIGHFYEKLLLLKDMMNTETGKEMAKDRHEFMEKYLEQFYKEFEF